MSDTCLVPAVGIAVYGILICFLLAVAPARLPFIKERPLGRLTATAGLGYSVIAGLAVAAARCEGTISSWGNRSWGILVGSLMWLSGMPLFAAIPNIRRLPISSANRVALVGMWTAGAPVAGGLLGALIGTLAGIQFWDPLFAVLMMGGLLAGCTLLWWRTPSRFLGVRVSAEAPRSALASAYVVPAWITAGLLGAPLLAVIGAASFATHIAYWAAVLRALRQLAPSTPV